MVVGSNVLFKWILLSMSLTYYFHALNLVDLMGSTLFERPCGALLCMYSCRAKIPTRYYQYFLRHV